MQHIQQSMIEITEEQAKDKVWSEVISWVGQLCVLEKAGKRGKVREVLVARTFQVDIQDEGRSVDVHQGS